MNTPGTDDFQKPERPRLGALFRSQFLEAIERNPEWAAEVCRQLLLTIKNRDEAGAEDEHRRGG